jgi:protein-tyrosine-phosphatase
MDAETLAQIFHETYERLAPEHGYETRKESAKPWEEVPANNKSLMVAVCGEILARLQPVRPMVPHLAIAMQYVVEKVPDFDKQLKAFLADQADPTGLRIDNLRMQAQFLKRNFEVIDGLLASMEVRDRDE